ncbi:hypothetical protein [Nocardia sp. NPDC050435]|uniref:hypothetical protein n=1 Tax=Nocardia sp. NPDC050435 TaxID=3155040 RepID=UPI0033D21AB0
MLDLDALLREGATLTVAYGPGERGACNEDGFVVAEPYDGIYYAVVLDQDGLRIAGGSGRSGGEAVAALRPERVAAAGALPDDPPF